MNRCDVEVGEMEELITLDVLNHYLYKVLETPNNYLFKLVVFITIIQLIISNTLDQAS